MLPILEPESELRRAKARTEAFRVVAQNATHAPEFARTRVLASVRYESSMGTAVNWSVYVTSAFVEFSRRVTTVPEVLAFAREVEAARLAGAVPRELRVAL